MKTENSIRREGCPKTVAGRLGRACAARLLPALLLLLLALPVTAQAQFTYTTNNGTITITGYTGPGGDVTIPDTINGLPVTSIGHYAFMYCDSLTSVTIGTNVTNIGNDAFWSCFYLTSITIPDSVTSIANEAFGWCTSLAMITVDASNPAYSSVDGVLFNKSQTALIQYPWGKVGSYTIPNRVTSIGDSAFANCSELTSVTIPTSVTSIGDYAFFDCTKLTVITVDALNSNYSSADGVLFNKSQTTLIQYPGGKAGGYTIPNSVTSIVDGAFWGCALTSVTIGTNFTSIRDNAFCRCYNLTNVSIPNSVTSIGVCAFGGCSSLTSFTIPSSVTNIGGGAFDSCYSLTSVYFQGNAPSVDADSGVFGSDNNATVYYLPGTTGWSSNFAGLPAFLWDPLSQVAYTTTNGVITITRYPGPGGAVTIPSTINGLPVTGIGDSAFANCSELTSVAIPSGVTNIGAGPFAACTNLTEITVDALSPAYCSVAGILFDKSQTRLIQYPGGKAGGYTIPNSVTSIGDRAFSGCSSLTRVSLPNSVTNIVDEAFYGCGSLTSVYFQGNAPSFGADVFLDFWDCWAVFDPATVYYLPGTTGWSTNFAGLPAFLWDSSVSVGYTTNDGSVTITRYTGPGGAVAIPSTINGLPVTSIGDSAFAYCSELTSVTIPSGVTNIGAGPFARLHQPGGDHSGCPQSRLLQRGGGLVRQEPDQAHPISGGKSRNLLYDSQRRHQHRRLGVLWLHQPDHRHDPHQRHQQDGAFGCTNLTSVYFQGNAPSFGAAVFSYQTGLEGVGGGWWHRR